MQQSTQLERAVTVSPGELPARSGRAARSAVSILHVLAPGAYGGLEQVVRALATGHADSGHTVHVAALIDRDASEHPFTAALAQTRVSVHGIVCPPRSYLAETRVLTELCRRFRPTVVHTHGYHADLVAGRVARRCQIPAVTTVHGFTGGDWKNRCYEWLQRRVYRRYDRVVAVSRPMVSQLRQSGVPSSRIALVPNAWSPSGDPLPRSTARAALEVEQEACHIGWVGRISAEKGLDVLIEALAHLKDLPVVVSVIGDGPERSRVERLAEQLGVQQSVRWQGVRPDAWQFFTGFDLFTLSSRTEGTPIVLFEAIAAGVPVVTTAVGGVPDVVSAREALLVPPENPRALAEAIRRAYHDSPGARERASAAFNRLQSEFSADVWLDRYTDLYRSIAHVKDVVNP